MKVRYLFCLLVVLVILPGDGLAQPGTTRTEASAGAAWRIECADCPRLFSPSGGDHSLRLDAEGHPHVVYGGSVSGLYYARHDGVAWRYEQVDPALNVGSHADLALDAAGRPHIAYYDAENEDLKYAFWTGSLWAVEVVDSEGNAGRGASLALDAAGRPHISYSGDNSVKYARRSGGAWSVEVVGSLGATVQTTTSLALDAGGNPYIAWAYGFSIGRDPAMALAYAAWTGSEWLVDYLTSGGHPVFGQDASLALDAAGNAHISYRVYSLYGSEPLEYVHWTGSAWDVQVVDSSSYGGQYSSLALDDEGHPHISYAYYYTDLDRDLKYAAWTGSAWQVETVESDGALGFNTSLALDAAGSPHIIHYSDSSVLRYVFWTGSSWSSEVVDSSTLVGRASSLALDASGAPHISYYDSSNRDLKYAVRTTQGWIAQTVRAAGSVGSSTSLAVDANGWSHIGYSSQGALEYVAWTGSAWLGESVDSLGYDNDISIVLDADSQPHISYDNLGNHRVRYAYRTSDGWQAETVEDGSADGAGTSLALDAAGNPHISYHNGTTQELKYATRTSLGWQVQLVGSGEGGWPSLALDAAGYPHIAFLSSSGLQYARWTGSAWDIELVDSIVFGGFPSLALDAAGQPHIIYSGLGGLGYAARIGGTWQFQLVVAGAYYSSEQKISLALDGAGTPHISYQGLGALKYARPYEPPYPLKLEMEVMPRQGLEVGGVVTYVLTLSGPEVEARLWDPLPAQVEYISGTLTAPAVYSETARAIEWQGALPIEGALVVHFEASAVAGGAIVNTAWLSDTLYGSGVSATAVVNGGREYLPLILRLAP